MVLKDDHPANRLSFWHALSDPPGNAAVHPETALDQRQHRGNIPEMISGEAETSTSEPESDPVVRTVW